MPDLRLRISQVNKRYEGGVVALDNINLTIKQGVFGLLGPNGAGKSTLMRIIATLQTPDSGELIFDEIDVLETPQLIRPRLGYLPQEFGVYPKVSCLELLDHLAVLKGYSNKYERKAMLEELMAVTNLVKHQHAWVSNFSGGMRQRFGIAQALLGNPDLLIVDEPTAGLDPEERNRFHDLLAALAETKIIILSTHIVEDVSELCQDMAVLGNGKILLQGDPAELTQSLEDRIWRRVVQRYEIEEYEAQYKVISKRLFAGQTVLHVLADSPPEGFESAPASLQDVYFHALEHA